MVNKLVLKAYLPKYQVDLRLFVQWGLISKESVKDLTLNWKEEVFFVHRDLWELSISSLETCVPS